MVRYEYINEKGRALAERIKAGLESNNSHASRFVEGNDEAVVFVGALGICVRKILPLAIDKHTDPAVVCVDTTGRYVIPVIGGHVGGANALATEIAKLIGGEAVVTTQSDNLGLWALDTLAKDYGWIEAFEGISINEEIAMFVNGEPTALYVDVNDKGTEHLLATLPEHVTVVDSVDDITEDKFRLAIIVSPMEYFLPDEVKVLQYIPQCVHIGIGLAHQASPAENVLSEILNAVSMAGVCLESIVDFNTIDVKADEPVIKLLQEDGMKVNFYTAEELSKMDVPNPSATVSKHVGTPSVSEAAAMIHGTLILPKQKGSNWTVAISKSIPIDRLGVNTASPRGGMEGTVGQKGAHIEIVGAGPGDPELISVRGRRFLEHADLILYAGSLVPKQLTECHKPGAEVVSSADMNLEEQFALMKEHYDKGHLIVRLHTGDPCIYGAIQEQMAYFDKYHMSYHITPGISSFLAAAAELQSQFTIPERCQTIILTRGEGRTPMPEREKLHMLASHQSTMCIFLSASIVEDVQRELLEGGYPPETPVAACYRLTWKDQRIYRGQLKDLTRIVKENGLTLTTMIVVGDAIDNRNGLSKLYDGHFTHLFRKGEP